MPPVLDLVLAVVIVGRIIKGIRNGLLVGALGLAGVGCGGFLGLWAGPRLVTALPVLDSGRLIRTITLVVVLLVGIVLGEFVGGLIGRRIRGRDRAQGWDAALGGIAAAVIAALVTWGALSLARPVAPSAVRSAIDGSIIYRALDTAVPNQFDQVPQQALNSLVNALPKAFGGVEPSLPVAPPNNNSASSPGVDAAAASIVQVMSQAPACTSDASGSGWVVANERVVTNAHVVAGADRVQISVRGTAAALDATTVAFDPKLDLAVLSVPGLKSSALARATGNQPTGQDVVAAGFPWGGPYTLSAARIRGTVTEQSNDIYGGPGIPREVYSIRGVVRPGNSGGPLLTLDGSVAGTVFAMSVVDNQTGYVLTDAATAPILDQAASLVNPVGTGSCVAR